jgi:hypothetical protein
MNNLIKTFTPVLFICFGFTQEADSEKKFITAEYCFDFDEKHNYWLLLHYKQIVPLKIQIPQACYEYDAHVSIDFDTNYKVGIISPTYGNCDYRPKKNNNYKCKIPINTDFNIYNLVEIAFAEDDSTEVFRLSNKIHPVKWKLDFKCDEKQIFDLQGTFNIFISGICSEEQLKKINEKYENYIHS